MHIFCEKRTDHPGHYYVFCAQAECVPISKERCLRCTKVKDHLLFSKLKNCPMTCIAPLLGRLKASLISRGKGYIVSKNRATKF